MPDLTWTTSPHPQTAVNSIAMQPLPDLSEVLKDVDRAQHKARRSVLGLTDFAGPALGGPYSHVVEGLNDAIETLTQKAHQLDIEGSLTRRELHARDDFLAEIGTHLGLGAMREEHAAVVRKRGYNLDPEPTLQDAVDAAASRARMVDDLIVQGRAWRAKAVALEALLEEGDAKDRRRAGWASSVLARGTAAHDRELAGSCSSVDRGGWAGDGMPCELASGHDGKHRNGAVMWGA